MNPVLTHTVLESAAYFLGFRYFLRERRRLALPALADTDRSLWIGVAAILGAALGAKLGFWIEDPRAAFADFPDWRHLLQGKTIVGALLGGLAAVELAKWRLDVRASSGDAFAFPLMLGIAVGRVGCFLAGLADHIEPVVAQGLDDVETDQGFVFRDDDAAGLRSAALLIHGVQPTAVSGARISSSP